MSAFTEANTIQDMLAETAGCNGWTVCNKDLVDVVNKGLFVHDCGWISAA